MATTNETPKIIIEKAIQTSDVNLTPANYDHLMAAALRRDRIAQMQLDSIKRDKIFREINMRVRALENEIEEQRSRHLDLIKLELEKCQTYYYKDQSGLFKPRKKDNEHPAGLFSGLNKFLHEGITVNHKVDQESVEKSADKVKDKVKETVSESTGSFFNKFIPSSESVQKFTTPLSVIAFLLAAIQWYREGKFTSELFLGAIVLLLPAAYTAIKPYIIQIWQVLVKSIGKSKEDKDSDEEKKEEGKEKEKELYDDQIGIPNFLSFDICPSSIKMLTGAIAGIILGFAIKDARGLAQTVDRMTKLKDFPNLANGLYGVFDWFITALETIINWVRGLFKADKWFFWTSEFVEAEKAIKDGYAAISKYTSKERLTLNDIRYIEKLASHIQKMEIELPKKANRELILIANLKRAMIPLIQRVRRTNVQGSAGRISPVSILLCGESAIGKSNAQIAFAKAVCALLLPKERLELFLNDPSEEIYARNVLSQYWEGYRSQFMIWYDDLAFMKTVAGQSSAESEMIPVKNEIPHMPDMAFGDKGKIFLNSDVILATSNFYKFVPENLAYPQAFINRWDVAYVVSVDPKSEYCANPEETDPRRRRLKKNVPDVIEWYTHLQFFKFDIRAFHRAQEGSKSFKHPVDADIRNFLTEECTFTETVHDFVEMYNAKRTKSVKLLNHQNDIISDFVQFRKEKGEPVEQFVEKSETSSVPGGMPKPMNDQTYTNMLKQLKQYEEKCRSITSDKTVKAYEDEDGLASDDFEEEMKYIEERINEITKIVKAPKELLKDATVFQQGLKMSSSSYVDGDSFYRIKVNRKIYHEKFNTFQKERNIMRLKSYKNDEPSTGAYCPRTIDYIISDQMRFEGGLCPIMSNDPSLVVTPLGVVKGMTVSLEAKYLTNYYLALKSDRETCINILKDVPSEAIEQYPSLQNPLFIKQFDLGKTDEEEYSNIAQLGTFLGSMVRICQLRQSEKMYRAKKAFKNRLYDLFNISKEGLKGIMCPGNWLANIWDVLKNAAYMIAIVISMGYITKGVQDYTNLLPIWGENKNEDQSNSNINAKEMRQSRKPLKAKPKDQSAFADNLVDNHVSQIMARVHRRNVYLMYVGKVLLGTVTFVKGHIAIMPKHFKTAIDSAIDDGLISSSNPLRMEQFESKIVEGKVIGGFSFYPKPKHFVMPKGDLAQQDVMFLNATGTGHQPCTPIVENFISLDDLDDEDYAFHGTIYKNRGVNKSVEKDIDLRVLQNVECKKGVRNKFSWNYQGDTVTGDCGSLIAIHNHKIARRKIAGFHTQGRNRMSCGAVIFMENIEEELDLINCDFDTVCSIADISLTDDQSANLNYCSLWKEKEFLTVPRHNPMCKSPLNGLVSPVKKIPTNANKYVDEAGNVIDPCIKTLNKATADNVAIDDDVVKIIVEERYKRDKRVAPIETHGPGKIFSVEEACAGVEGDPLLKPIPRASSAGHPENVVAAKAGGGKYLWFGKGDTFSFDSDYFKKLKAEVLDIIYYSNKGVRYTFIYFCFPKFETLAKEEVINNRKIRMIYGGPLKLSCVYRCLYMEFNKYLITNRIYNGFAAGINEHSEEWNVLGKILEPLNLIIGDHKGFDFRNKATMLASHAYHANLYYEDEYKRAREIIAIEAFNAKILFEGVLYDKKDGLGSGNPGTLFFNGDSNQECLIYSSCLVVFPDIFTTEKETLRNFIAELLLNSYICVQGDDFVYGVGDRFKGVLTFHTVRKAAKKIGYEITPADKSDPELAPDYTPLEDATFLKRHFKKVKGKYIAPLDMDSIDDMIQWVNKRKYSKTDFEQVLETYLGELSLHGESVWYPKFKRLIAAARRVKLTWTPRYFNCEDYFNAITESRRFATMTVADVWDYIDAKSDRLDKYEDEDLTDKVLNHWRQVNLIDAEEYDEMLMEDESACLHGKLNMKNAFMIDSFLASLAIYDFDQESKRLRRLEKPRKNKKRIVNFAQLDGDQKQEILDSWNLELSLADQGAINLGAQGKVPNRLQPKHLLFEDQSPNMNSTTANTHDEIPENNHNDQVTITSATTEFTTSDSNNFTLTNSRLENKLRRIVEKQNDVRAFFAKKKEIGSFSWATTDAIGTKLATFDIDFLQNNTAMWSDKSRGYMNFRGTAVLTLQVNATPFHSGIFRVVWKPYVSNDPDWASFDRLHSINVVQISQLPGIYHNISTDTCQMKAPIIGPVDSKTLGAQPTTWNFGFFEVFVYCPLDYGAADTINVRAFLSFEEVEIDTPFYNQSGNMKGKKNPTVEEKKEKGIISSTAGNLIPVVRGLSSVPFLSNIVGPAEWVLKVVKGGAEAVGWSKPTITSTMSRMYNNNMSYALNTNGCDPSLTISLDAENSVTALAKAGLNAPMDEASINFIKSQPAYYTNINWTTANLVGDNLATWEQRPSYFTQTGTFPLAVGNLTTYYMTPVCFISNMFRYWRGDLEFKLMFSKTGYHSGTIAVTYVPGQNAAGLTYANSQYNFREIIDIQTCEEFCFTVPYVVPDPYKHYLSKAGSIYIHVVNPLKCPTTVAQGINIAVIVNGGKSSDFQVPLQKTPQVVYVDQGGDITNEGCAQGNLMNDGEELTIAYSAMCIGESIRSVKQLVQAYCQIITNVDNPLWPTPMTGSNVKSIFFRPLDVHVSRYQNTAGVWAKATTYAYESDRFSTLASCYLFMRGSMRYALTTAVDGVRAFIHTDVPVTTSPNISTTTWTDVINLAPQFRDASFATFNDTDTTCMIKDPYYNKYPLTLTIPNYVQTQGWATRYGNDHCVGFTKGSAGPHFDIQGDTGFVQRAVGDDFQFTFWLGVPTLYFP